jgi:hypothetical protein
MATRIHWAFDGTIFYMYNSTTSVKLRQSWAGYLNPMYTIDSIPSTATLIDPDAQQYMWNFPNTIQISKVGLRLSNGASWCNLNFEVSNDSTDGFDGSWTTLASNQNYPTAYAYQEFGSWSLVDAKWLRIHRYGTNDSVPTPTGIFIFGDYQSPLFEFWDSAESTVLTGDYPLSLADAPNDANYTDTFSFKVKNTDASAHQYTITISPTKYHDMRYYDVDDAVIADDFFISDDGGATKSISLTTDSVVAGDFSDTITIYGDVLKSNNPGDGKHYFWIDVVEVITLTDDVFSVGTEQNLLTGGDGAKSYGWNLLNSNNATVANVNTSNAGKLTIHNDNTSTKSGWLNDFTGPFVYQEIQGDFDIETYLSGYSGATNDNFVGMIVRDSYSTNDSGTVDQTNISMTLRYYSGAWGVCANSVPHGGWNYTHQGGTIYPYMRIRRVGYDFYVYGKANAGDAWIQYADPTNTTKQYWRRPQFRPLVQVGLIMYSTNTSGNCEMQIDYFRTTV